LLTFQKNINKASLLRQENNMTDPSESKSWTTTTPLSQPLLDSDLHIWCVSLNVSPQELPNYINLLSPDELERARRFVFEKDRNHFITARGFLRTILGNYLQLEPAQIEFVYGPYGKPALKPGIINKALEFNLSHSKDLAVYAFNWDQKLGVDLEYVQPMPNMAGFAELYFSPRETAFINALSGSEKEQAFFKLWTGKEAFLKANGSGLTEPLNQVEISLQTWKTFTQNTGRTHWHLEIFTPVPGYQAALAFEKNNAQIIFRNPGLA
jgi:4'-phosphopantetheinyl transferase